MTPNPSRSDDRRLLDRISSGDAAALKLLYERLSGAALALAWRVLGNRGDAEEVVQEAFVQVWRRAQDYDASRGGAAGWVLTIARSRAIDRLRARGASDRAVASSASLEPEAEPEESPLDVAERRQLRERIRTALASLPKEQRAAIELAYFEGLSQSEIAAKTGDPLGTVKTRIRIALGKLATLLDEGGPGEPK